MFKVSDIWGIAAAMLTLIALYLIVRNPSGATSVLKASFTGTSDLVQKLQGR